MIELGLQRISRLSAHTSFPWRAIHVAGTNGKGSICAYVSSMLEAFNGSKYREKYGLLPLSHARFTSPHLVHRWDCITINQRPIAEREFLDIESRVLDRNRLEDIGASEFEIQTATAFEAFTQLNLDVAVVEVGMGGKLDSTNILGRTIDSLIEGSGTGTGIARPLPLVTAISKIGLDHQGFLGDTIEEIAQQKAGIIKPGVPVVYDFSNQPSVRSVIESTATTMGSPSVHWLSPNLRPQPLPEQTISKGGATCVNELLARAGENHKTVPQHVQHNFSVAFRCAWLALKQLGRISLETDRHAPEFQDLVTDMATAARRTVIPGRQQYLDISALTGRRDQTVLLDGAHNAQSAQILARETGLLRARSGSDITWVLAASDTKDMTEILRPLLSANDSVFAVEFGPVDGMPWVQPMSAAKILRTAREVVPDLRVTQDCGGDVLGALRMASDHATPTGSTNAPINNLVMAGSLYLVGDVHRLISAGEK